MEINLRVNRIPLKIQHFLWRQLCTGTLATRMNLIRRGQSVISSACPRCQVAREDDIYTSASGIYVGSPRRYGMLLEWSLATSWLHFLHDIVGDQDGLVERIAVMLWPILGAPNELMFKGYHCTTATWISELLGCQYLLMAGVCWKFIPHSHLASLVEVYRLVSY